MPSASPDDELNSAADESNDRLSDEILSAQDDGLVKESGLEPEGKKPKASSLKKMFSNSDTPSSDPVAALRAEHGESQQSFQREGIDGPITDNTTGNAGSKKGLNIVAIGSTVAMLVLLLFFGFTSFQLTGRVNQVDATLLAVGNAPELIASSIQRDI